MKKVWDFLKKHWLLIAEVLGGILAVIAIGHVVAEMRQALVGKVERQENWEPVPGDPHTIVVKQGSTWTPLQLPPSVTSDQVKSVQLDPSGPGVVEVKNATVGSV